MTLRFAFLAGLASLLLSACGGGGGVNSAGSTPVVTQKNTSITNLVASQLFANDASTTTVAFDLAAKVATSTSTAQSTLSISYDASSKSYTISTGGRSQSFAPADQTPSSFSGQTTFRKTSGSTSDYLTLVTTPFDTSTANKYVGLGFWQHNGVSGQRQDTNFDLFTFGLDTPATGVPRTGTANYAIDAFGFVNKAGLAPQTFQGTGTFDIDFVSGAFSEKALMSNFGADEQF